MKLNDILEFEKTLTREELDEFNKHVVDITQALHVQRAYDSNFIYSPFSDMNIRTAIYLGYLISKVEDGR